MGSMSRDALRPTIRYSDDASAPPSASRFPRLAPVPDRSPMKRPPAVTTPTATHSSGLVRSRNRTRSRTATNSGLMVTNTSEDNTEVIDSDVTHRAKCTARNAPANMTLPSSMLHFGTQPPLVLNRKARGVPFSVRMLHLCHILSLIHISEPTRLGMISYAV